MLSNMEGSGLMVAAGAVLGSVFRGIQRGVDRMLSIGYGVVYDYIFERFNSYRELHREILQLVEAKVPESVNRCDVRVLDIGCGPGNFAVTLAESGFSVLGIDPYDALVDLAQEKRRAKHLSNLAFQHLDLAQGNTFRDGSFDQVTNIHFLYVHSAPHQLLKEAYRVLKPGGHAVFVNFTRRVHLWPSVRELKEREGLGAALRCLLWVLPNTVFEATRSRVGPHYWGEDEFSAHLQEAGFTVLEMRRTFFNDASLLAWARKDASEEGGEKRTPAGSRKGRNP